MKKLFITLPVTILVFIFSCASLYAADNAAETSNEEIDEPLPSDPEQVAAETEIDSQTAGENTETPVDDNFVPTIQIAEDLPVAFPVDI